MEKGGNEDTIELGGIPVYIPTRVLVGGKATDFADALLRVLSDPSLSKELGWNARKVASKCRPRKIAEQVEEVYRDVAASRNTSP